MKRIAWFGVLAAVFALGLAGCEWETGSGADSWSSAFDWVNFSGVYRGTTTITLDSDYDPGTPATTNLASATFLVPPGQLAPVGPQQVPHGNLIPGSASISVPGIASLSDPDKDGILTGTGGTGHFNYSTGEWSILLDAAPAETKTGVVSYAYLIAAVEPTGNEIAGTQVDAYSYVVNHRAQDISLTDNTGVRYDGRISQIRSASGAQNTDITQVGTDETINDSLHAKLTYYESPLPENGDAIIASFEATGSGAKIVGTLEGVVVEGVFANRTLNGTRIAGGTSDDITAVASSITITVTEEEEGVEEGVEEGAEGQEEIE